MTKMKSISNSGNEFNNTINMESSFISAENKQKTMNAVIEEIENALDKADQIAEESSYRVSHKEGFSNLRKKL